jgi:siroheme synthase (precorrin-2 oxidase/ferrochelatase)
MDGGKSGKYKIQKTIDFPNAVEAQVDPQLSKQFKALTASKAENFKNITGEKIKKDKKDKSVGQERFKTNFELITGKAGTILQDNGGTTSNYKSIIFESENEDEAKQYFEKTKKQLQVLVRSWTEQSNTDNNFSASTDKDLITLSISSEERKKKKVFYLVNFIYN